MTPETGRRILRGHGRTALYSGRRPRAALAGLVLAATLLICLWIGTYQEVRGVGTGLLAFRYTPDWAVPVAIAIGLAGTVLALWIYRACGSADG